MCPLSAWHRSKLQVCLTALQDREEDTNRADRLEGKERGSREAEFLFQSHQAEKPTSSWAKLWPGALNKGTLERIPGDYEIGKRKNYFFIVIDLSLAY